jgi:transcriptional regulator with XRE-family HTH domain
MNELNNNKLFPQRLKMAREEKEWTQEYLAKMVKVTSQAISGYERGCREPDFEILSRLAQSLNVSKAYLLGETTKKHPYKTDDTKYSQEIIAAHKTKDLLTDLPPKARESVEEFIVYLRKKYNLDD